MKRVSFSLFFIVALICSGQIAYACPGCKDLIKFGEEAISKMLFGNGIAWSMVLMFSVPATIAGLIIYTIYKAEKKFKETNSNEQIR